MRIISSIFQVIVLVAALFASIKLLIEVAGQTFGLVKRIAGVFFQEYKVERREAKASS